MQLVRNIALCCLAGAMLLGCTPKPLVSKEQGDAIARQCVEETMAPGMYSISPARVSSNPEKALPRVRHFRKFGGTQEGEDAVNSCIRRTLLPNGEPQALPTGVRYSSQQVSTYNPMAGCTANSSVLQGGSSYCVK